MRQLEPADIHCLSAVTGWLELGNAVEAESELALLSTGAAEHPDALEVRYAVLSTQTRWEPALEVARRLTSIAPERVSGWLHQAYALRRAPGGGLKAAWDCLLPMHDVFPTHPTLAYNLACYACQMDQLAEAWRWLECAIQIAGKAPIKQMAMADPDLEPLQAQLSAL